MAGAEAKIWRASATAGYLGMVRESDVISMAVRCVSSYLLVFLLLFDLEYLTLCITMQLVCNDFHYEGWTGSKLGLTHY